MPASDMEGPSLALGTISPASCRRAPLGYAKRGRGVREDWPPEREAAPVAGGAGKCRCRMYGGTHGAGRRLATATPCGTAITRVYPSDTIRPLDCAVALPIRCQRRCGSHSGYL